MSLLCISSFFSLSVLLKLLKHVKLIIFENYNECKTKHLFLIKKVVTRFDKKIATWRKKSTDEEKNLLLRTLKKKTLSLTTQRRPYHWGLKEDPITEDLKRILSMRNLKRTLISVKTKDNAINGDPPELQDPQWLLCHKLTLFSFLVMVYDRVDDKDKFSKKNFGLGRLRFHVTSHSKVSPVLPWWS